jgi:O-antigen biosynthesis protein
MRVAFLINDLQLSGGVGVVLAHARHLSALESWNVTLVLVREQEEASWHGYPHLPNLRVCTREQALSEHYDVAVATWWETTFTLFELSADRHAYFVQSLEDRFYRHDEAERLGAGLTLDLPVSFITEAGWIAETIACLRPDATCHLVRNGVDKDAFAPLTHIEHRDEGPLRVLVEGSPTAWFKHLHDAIRAAGEMREPHHLTVVTGDREALGEVEADAVLGPLSHRAMAEAYERCDVVLKLSSVEGMFGPPLEGFHRGATCVVTPVTGHEEYVVHGFNGLITDWEDLLGTARQLDLLARDRDLLHFLRSNALQTARAWPSWQQSGEMMAEALLAIRDAPQPGGSGGTARMLADLRGGLELYHGHLRERSEFAVRAMRFERRLQQVRDSALVQRLLRLRRYRIVRLLARPMRPLTRRLKRLLA